MIKSSDMDKDKIDIDKNDSNFNADENELKEAFKSFESASKMLSEQYKKLEEEVKDLKENLSTVLESLPLGIIITDESEKIKFINKFLAELMPSYNLGNFLNVDIGDFIKKFFTEPAKSANFSKSPSEPELGDSNVGRRSSSHPVEMVMRIGKDRSIPVFLYRKSIYGNNKKYAGKIFIVQNIEEIKKIKRLAELGEMSAKIAHEIRNPLGSIDLFASILYKELDNDGHKEIAGNIIEAVKNLNSAITNTLEFSKAVNPKISNQNLLQVIDKSLLYASYALNQKKIKVIKQIDENIFARMDENLIGRSILNILINAAQAVRDDGKGMISIGAKIEKKDDDDESYIQIDIEDNGTGFSDDILPEVFTPFFSSRKTGGTGLGLAIALNNTVLHGGYMTAENSKKYGGAKLSIFLPYMA